MMIIIIIIIIIIKFIYIAPLILIIHSAYRAVLIKILL